MAESHSLYQGTKGHLPFFDDDENDEDNDRYDVLIITHNKPESLASDLWATETVLSA